MAKYINADALQQKMTQLRLEQSGDMDKINLIWQVQDMILQAPTVDVREAMSSAWIPVSERLPEKTGWYFTTCINQFGHKICRVAHYDYDWTDNKGFGSQIIAWMPMPEPYRGDE